MMKSIEGMEEMVKKDSNTIAFAWLGHDDKGIPTGAYHKTRLTGMQERENLCKYDL